MDYRMVDHITDPSDQDDLATETLIRLPGCFLCYQPPSSAPPLTPPPMLSQGFVTFGSFNNPTKLSDPTLDLWAELLRVVANARLLLKGPPFADRETAELFLARMAVRGIAAERMILHGLIDDPAGHLALYGAMDIALDPFPYNGTTTTCEALWMGVPVVSKRGDRHAARVGASLLHHAGFPELVADDDDSYIALVRRLSGDPSSLAAWRAGARTKLAASSLCDSQFCPLLRNVLREITVPEGR